MKAAMALRTEGNLIYVGVILHSVYCKRLHFVAC